MMTATPLDRVAAGPAATVFDARSWDRVVSEIRESCAMRAAPGELFTAPGAVGVLSGTAPVVWVHAQGHADVITRTLAASPEVDDVYVSATAEATADRLVAAGWRHQGLMTHLIRERPGWLVAPWLRGARELTAADLPAFRRTLAAAGGAEGRLLASSYGDDFFERARPAWLLGAYDGDLMIGTVGMRLQHDGAMVFALSVDPRHRGSGIAQELVRAAIVRAFGAGAAFVHALAEPASLDVALACGARPIGAWRHLVRDGRPVVAA